jgi:hypothetical protein
MSWIRYGYFIRLPNGVPVPSGHDFGPTEDTYKPGSSMGVKNGKEAIVIAVVKGEVAKRQGFDVIVLLEDREPGHGNDPGPAQDALDATLRVNAGAILDRVTPRKRGDAAEEN